MEPQAPVILVSAGEPSGDARAAELVGALRRLLPRLRVFGMGGDSLRAAGAEIAVDISDTAVFGLTEALTGIRRFSRIRRELLGLWNRHRPDAALLVDFGGFNLRLARSLKRLGAGAGARVAYYVSPQVWASRPGRIRWVRDYVDLMLTLFEFEEDLYRRHGVNAVHTGHPLVDEVKAKKTREEVCRGLGFDPERRVIGLMPGSRPSEIRLLLEPLLRAGEALGARGYGQRLIVAAPPVADMVLERVGEAALPVVREDRYCAMAACDLLLIASGTAALEAALLGVPSVVVYRTSPLTALAARLLLKVPHVSLPNIIAGEELLPELLQRRCRPELIAEEAAKIIEDSSRYGRIRARLRKVASSLGEPGAIERAARQLAAFLERG